MNLRKSVDIKNRQCILLIRCPREPEHGEKLQTKFSRNKTISKSSILTFSQKEINQFLDKGKSESIILSRLIKATQKKLSLLNTNLITQIAR
jgi:hypothetical protein